MSLKTSERALEALGWGQYQSRVFLTLFLVLSIQTWTIVLLYVASVSILMYESPSLSNTQKSLFPSVMSLGFLTGCLSGYLSDRFGRVHIFKKLVFFDLAGIIGLTIVPNYWAMLISVFILGIGAGGDQVLANTIAIESFPPSKRSKVTLLSVAWSFGLVFGYGLALALSTLDFAYCEKWRVVTICGIFLTSLSLYLRQRLLETPVFLYSKQMHAEYSRTINQIKKINGLDSDLYTRIYEEPADTKTPAKLDNLFGKRYGFRSLALCVVYFGYSFAYTGILFFMPIILPVDSDQKTFMVVLLQQLCGIPGQLIASCFVDSILGRRLTWMLGFGASGALLMVLTLIERFEGIIALTSVYYFLLSMSLSALFTHSQELYPEYMRGKSNGMLIALARIGSTIGPNISGLVFDWSGAANVVLMNAGGLVFVSMFAWKLKETKLTGSKHLK